MMTGMGAFCRMLDPENLNECFRSVDPWTIHDMWSLDTPYNTKLIGFCRGRIDDWCILFQCLEADGMWHRYAPRDKYYFNQLALLAQQYQMGLHPEKVWNHMMWLFYRMQNTRRMVDPDVMQEIFTLCRSEYGNLYAMALECFTLIYYGMIAEENKAFSKAGREIKMNGIHKVLMERIPVDIATTCQCSQPVGRILEENRRFGLIHEPR